MKKIDQTVIARKIDLNSVEGVQKFYAWVQNSFDLSVFEGIYSILFPKLLIYRDSIFLEFRFEKEIVDNWFSELGDSKDVELTSNELSSLDFFDFGSIQEGRDMLEFIALSWKNHIPSQTGRSVEVFIDESIEYERVSISFSSH